MTDAYLTISKPGEGLFKEKGSKFYGYVFSIKDEDEAKFYLELLKKQHNQARHWCYAWRLAADGEQTRANDDGEPSNSAGAPILGQLLSFDVTYSLGVVVRYFGGTKLGVGGLVTAYKKATQEALENASIVEAFVTQQFKFTYTYDQTSEVSRFLTAHQANIVHQTFEINCTTEVEIRSSLADSFYEQAKQLFGIKVEKKS
jgi:uncharacterized YigZ family protein